MQVDYGDEENDGDWKRSELDEIMKHERKTENVTDITGDTTTVYTQTGKVIRRTKDGVDITDQTDPNQLELPRYHLLCTSKFLILSISTLPCCSEQFSMGIPCRSASHHVAKQ